MIPLLLGGAAAIWGISNIADAESNAKAANRINKEAAELANNANKRVTDAHDYMMYTLDTLGDLKRTTSKEIGNVGDIIEDITKRIKMERNTKALKELESNGIYENLLMQMSTLSRQAEEFETEAREQFDVSENENATCVFGALGAAAFGFGMVAMPAMLLYSFMKSDEAEAAYYSAKTRMDEAKIYAERCNNMTSLFEAMTKRGRQIGSLLSGLNEYFSPSTKALNAVYRNYGDDYKTYPPESKMTVFYSFQLAQTIKTIVETSMFQEDGTFNTDMDKTLDKGHQTLIFLNQNT